MSRIRVMQFSVPLTADERVQALCETDYRSLSGGAFDSRA
jgi:hypothetical protein